MSDTFLALLFVALLVNIGVWILLYRRLARRLDALRPAGTRRQNGMDRFFGTVSAAWSPSNDAPFAIHRTALKISTLSFFLIFVAMMLGPFFLRVS